MRKRPTITSSNRLGSNNRRRQLLKRVHQKVASRRQHFQIIEATEGLAVAN